MLSRSEVKLESMGKELTDNYGVETRHMTVDFSKVTTLQPTFNQRCWLKLCEVLWFGCLSGKVVGVFPGKKHLMLQYGQQRCIGWWFSSTDAVSGSVVVLCQNILSVLNDLEQVVCHFMHSW